MSCDRSSECERPSTHNKCYGCTYQYLYKKVKICEEDSPLARKAKQELRNRCFNDCSIKERKTGGRYRMDRVIEDILLERVREWDPTFPKLYKLETDRLKVRLEESGKCWNFTVKCDAAFETESGKRILVEVKGYGADTNSIYSAILAAKIVKNDTSPEENEAFKDCLFYYFCMESKAQLESAPNRGKIIEWANHTHIIDGFFGIDDLDDFFDNIKRNA